MLKGTREAFVFTMLACLVGVWFASSGSNALADTETEPGLTASLVPNQTSVGGIITLQLKFRLPKGARPAPKPMVTGLNGLEILDRQMTPKIPPHSPKADKKPKRFEKQAAGEYRFRLMVNRLDSGDVGPFSLSYIGADGKEAFLKAGPVPLTILSNLGDKPEQATLKPIYGIVPTQSFLLKYRFWIIGGILLLLLGAAFELWFRNRQKKASSEIAQTPPDRIAIRNLKALDGRGLFEKGRIKDFYFEYSEILRHYLEAIRGFPAAEYTLEEIARTIRNKEDQALLGLLRRADMVKFADSTATPAAKTRDMEAAYAYIRNTREPVMTEAAMERRGGRRYAGGKTSPAQKEGAPS